MPMEFGYVNITTDGCEGWLNLFFGEHVVGLVNNVWLADRIREYIDSTEPTVEADARPQCKCKSGGWFDLDDKCINCGGHRTA